MDEPIVNNLVPIWVYVELTAKEMVVSDNTKSAIVNLSFKSVNTRTEPGSSKFT